MHEFADEQSTALKFVFTAPSTFGVGGTVHAARAADGARSSAAVANNTRRDSRSDICTATLWPDHALVKGHTALWERGPEGFISAVGRGSIQSGLPKEAPPMRGRHHRGTGGSAGAEVLGVDIASNLVAAGKARPEELGLTNLSFQEGDALNLNELDDESFDLVISIFGAMFAPKPFDVAKEMVRVTKPGGRIVMGNWIPNDPTLVAQVLKISASYSPRLRRASSAR